MPPGDHHLATDAHGCTYYTTPIVPTICACLCFRADLGAPSPDAGTADDAGAADDAGVDDAGVDDAGAADDGGVDGAAP